MWLGLDPLHPEQTGGLLGGNGLQCWGLNHSGVAVGVCPSRMQVGRDGWWSGTVYQRTKDKWMLEKKSQVFDPQVPSYLHLVAGGLMLHL